MDFWMSIRVLEYFLCFAFISDLCQTQESALPPTVVGTCGGTQDAKNGYIASPGYPKENYPNNANCTYTITAEPGNIITYQSVLTDLEVKDPKTDKCHDFIQLFDGNILLGQSIKSTGKFCGSQNIPLNATRGNILRVHFTSDQLTNSKGFVLQWSILNPTDMESSFNCNFDGPTPLCPGWAQSADDFADWMFERGKTRTQSTGPSADHTEDTTDGRYAYIEASEIDENEWADLITPSVGPNREASYCLNFWYHMYGQKIGTLQVLRVFEGEDEGLEVFTAGGNIGDVWNSAEINLKGGEKAFYLIFRATRGESFYSDIAIDDVTITSEQCPSFEETTAIPEPGTGTATADYYFTTDSLFTKGDNCTGDRFLCDDGLDCIDNSYVCDEDVDCADGSDENNCPKCKENLIWKSCGSACDRTCADGEDGPVCTLQCVQKCGCPASEPVLHNGRCIRYEDCPTSLTPLEEVVTASVSDITLDSAILTFKTVPSAKSFSVKLYEISSPEPVQKEQINNVLPTLRITFFNLEYGTTYRITIESESPEGETALSSVELKFTTIERSEVTTGYLDTTEAYTGEYYGTTGFDIQNTESPVDDVTTTTNTGETTMNLGTFIPTGTTGFFDYETTVDITIEKEQATQNPETLSPTDADTTVDDVITTSPSDYYDDTTIWDYGTTEGETVEESTAQKAETTLSDQTTNSITEAGAAATEFESTYYDTEFEITTDENVAAKITPPVTEIDATTQENVIQVTESPEIGETTEYYLDDTTINDFEVTTESSKEQTTESIEDTTYTVKTATTTLGPQEKPTTTTLTALETTIQNGETTLKDLEETTNLEPEITETPTTTALTALETTSQYDETTLQDLEETTKLGPGVIEVKTTETTTLTPQETTAKTEESTIENEEETTNVAPEIAKTTTLASKETAISDETTVKQIEETTFKEPETTQTTTTTPIIPLKATPGVEKDTTVIIEVTESPDEVTTEEDLKIKTHVVMTTTEPSFKKQIEATDQPDTTTKDSTTSSFVGTKSPETEREETQSLFEDLQPGENITLSSDLTASGMYKKNYTKLFNFIAAENYIVRVTFTKLSVHCDDGLHVYDDFFIGDEIVRICGLYDVIESGRSLPVVISTINMMTMLFRTDDVNESSGFEMIVDSIPESSIPNTACGTKLVESVGEIASPNFPSQSEMSNCEYQFDLTEKQYLEMQFKLFSLGDDAIDPLCDKNSLSITSSDEVLYKYCGILLPPPITLSKSGKISVTSDGLQPGFWISYEIKECELEGQIYSESAPSCDNACINNVNTECIYKSITTRCHCPEDKPILFIDRCITVSECENPSLSLTTESQYETTEEVTAKPALGSEKLVGEPTEKDYNENSTIQINTTPGIFPTDEPKVSVEITESKLVSVEGTTEAAESTESFETSTESITGAATTLTGVITKARLGTTDSLESTESLETTSEKTTRERATTVVDKTNLKPLGTTDSLETTESLETTSEIITGERVTSVADGTTRQHLGTTDSLESTESLETTSEKTTGERATAVVDEITQELLGTTASLESTESLETTSESIVGKKATTAADETTQETLETTDSLESTESLETTSEIITGERVTSVADGTTRQPLGTTDSAESTESLEATSVKTTGERATTVVDETTQELSGTTASLESTESLETTSESIVGKKATTAADETTQEPLGTTDSLESTESMETTSESTTGEKRTTVADGKTPESLRTTDSLGSTESLETTSESTTGTGERPTTVTDKTTLEPLGTTDSLESTESLEITSENTTSRKATTVADETTQEPLGTTDLLGSTEGSESTTVATTSTSLPDETTQELLETTDVLGSTESFETTSESTTSATLTTLAGETTQEPLGTTESDFTTPDFTTDILGSTKSFETTSESTTSATPTTLADETTQEPSGTTESDFTTPDFTTDILGSTESFETTPESTTSITITTQAAETTVDTQETTWRVETTESELTTFKITTDNVKTTEAIGEFTTKEYTTEPYTNISYTTESNIETSTTEQVTTPQTETTAEPAQTTEDTDFPDEVVSHLQTEVVMVLSDMACLKLSNVTKNTTYKISLEKFEASSSELSQPAISTHNIVSKNGHISKCVYNLTQDTSYTFTVKIDLRDDVVARKDFTTKAKTVTPVEVYEQTEETKQWRNKYIGWRNSFTDWIETYNSYSDIVETKLAEDLQCPKQLHKPPCKEELTPLVDSNGCFLLVCKSGKIDAEFTQDDVRAWEEEFKIYNDYLMPLWKRSFQNYVAQIQDDEKDA